MGHIHTVAHFDAPVERVFEVATDVKLLPSYMASVSDINDLQGPPSRVGSTYRFHSTGLGQTMAGTIEVIEIERPTLFKTLTTYDNGMRVTWTQHMGEAGSGTDEVDDVDFELPFGPAALLGPLVRRQFERAMRDSIGPYTELIMRRPATPG
jgi:uncharacterized protein YndB with AHSA1/START domain